MKSKLSASISILFILFNYMCSGQDLNSLIPPEDLLVMQNEQLADSVNLIGSSSIKKGNIILNNGDVIKFSNLTVFNDTVFFTKSGSVDGRLPLNNITGITKTKSKPGMGALCGGIAGFFSGLLIGSLVNPERTVDEWIFDQIDGDEEVQTISKEDLPYMAIGTASGIAIGALVGLSLKKSTVVYHKNSKIDVFPGVSFYPNQNTGLMLSVKITFN
jgi:hypothetical protein